MVGSMHRYVKERNIGRRRTDYKLRDLNHHYRQLLDVVRLITSEMNLDALFEVIMDQTNKIMGCERSTVFLFDRKRNELWSMIATGMGRNEIRIPSDYGVAGCVFQSQTPILINDAYNDPRFYPEIDKKTGFRTRSLFCAPVVNRNRECIGILEALNKISGDFNEEDTSLLTSVSHYVAIALENARLYEELKALDKAKERIMNHLSHELKTPLSIIGGVLGKLAREIPEEKLERIQQAVDRGQRNIHRLLELQAKIDDILGQRSIEEKNRIIHMIEDALSFVEEVKEGDILQGRESLFKRVSERLESLYTIEESLKEKIQLDRFLREICQEGIVKMHERDLEIVMDFQPGLTLEIDRKMLSKVCSGLLRNAIENTPDEGQIAVSARSGGEEIRIDFCDSGIGITLDNQRLIFGGFFHTQATEDYSTKRPYAFNAGGAGSDLLRTKIFSERHGFIVEFESVRCAFRPRDEDQCPGRISLCPYIKNKWECISSGGSTFSIRFPALPSAI